MTEQTDCIARTQWSEQVVKPGTKKGTCKSCHGPTKGIGYHFCYKCRHNKSTMANSPRCLGCPNHTNNAGRLCTTCLDKSGHEHEAIKDVYLAARLLLGAP